MHSNGFSEFIPALGDGGYVATRPAQLTEARWRWIWRQNRARIVDAGAAIVVGGRVYVHPSRMDSVLLALGREAAERRLGADEVLPDPAALPAPGPLVPPGASVRPACRRRAPSIVAFEPAAAAAAPTDADAVE